MALLAADVHIPVLAGSGVKLGIPAVGADTFFAGALIAGDQTNGKCQVMGSPASTDGDTFLGICAKQKVVAAADELVEVYISGIFLIPFTGAVVTDVGQRLFMDLDVDTDNPGDTLIEAEITVADGDFYIGNVKVISGTSGWVEIRTGHIAKAVGIDEAFTHIL